MTEGVETTTSEVENNTVIEGNPGAVDIDT
jgi:hypothetical protein